MPKILSRRLKSSYSPCSFGGVKRVSVLFSSVALKIRVLFYTSSTSQCKRRPTGSVELALLVNLGLQRRRHRYLLGAESNELTAIEHSFWRALSRNRLIGVRHTVNNAYLRYLHCPY